MYDLNPETTTREGCVVGETSKYRHRQGLSEKGLYSFIMPTTDKQDGIKLNIQYSKYKVQMTSKQEKKCSMSLAIRRLIIKCHQGTRGCSLVGRVLP